MTDLPIRVVSGSPTDEETAAIAALFTGLLLERAAASLPLPPRPVRSAWARGTRFDDVPFPRDEAWRAR